MIGKMYYKGIGVDQNYELATKYFKMAAEKGYVHAMYHYGTIASL